jgi:7-cyano-7-deazaguanine synthase
MDAKGRDRCVDVLLSGGIDSSACLSYYVERGFDVSALFIDYGQVAAQAESIAASGVSNHFGIELRSIQLRGSSVKGEGYISGRNSFLLNCAILESRSRTSIISIGIHSGSDYVDCTESFIKRMQAIFDIYTKGEIRIDAPFKHWTKSDVWTYLLSSGLPVELTYSCELGTIPPCGTCLSCRDVEALHASA